MSNKISILSTKTLAASHRQALISANINLIEENFISTEKLEFELININQSLIFTSQNAVSSVLEHADVETLKSKKTYCVGVKTKNLLTENGYEVVAYTDYASDLAEIISLIYKSESFTFFSGNLRKDDLPKILKNGGITFNEIEVYQTQLTPQKVKQTLDGIMFFSPSGIESFLQKNKITTEICFCIGATTAEILDGITNKIIVPEVPNIDLFVETIIKELTN